MLAGGWFFAGWFTQNEADEDLPDYLTVWFEKTELAGPVTALYFRRDDLPENGIGFLFFLPGAWADRRGFKRFSMNCGGVDRNLYATNLAGAALPIAKLLPRLRFMAGLAKPSAVRGQIFALLGAAEEAAGQGYIEFYGQSPKAGGWFVSGWVASGVEHNAPLEVTLSFADSDIQGIAVTTSFARLDIQAGARGFVLFVRSAEAATGALQALYCRQGGARVAVAMMPGGTMLQDDELRSRLHLRLGQARPGAVRDELLTLLGQLPYNGADTMAALAPAVNLFIDEAIICGDAGMALTGWMLAWPGTVAGLYLCAGDLRVEIPMQQAIRTFRQDALESLARHGFDDPVCGFVMFVPGPFTAATKPYIEVETDKFEVGYRNITPSGRRGTAAIKYLLNIAEPRFAEIAPAFDNVLGPAITGLNCSRLAPKREVTLADFGPLPAKPLVSVIIPLYGRLDFASYQLALFSAHPGSAAIEYIYVLDDPGKKAEAYQLFAAAWERYQVPFRAVFMERNMGFAPACNAGLNQASGTYVAFVNSDVFPGTPDWLERLCGRLAADESIGVIGPLLLYEDGAVQHRGMYFKRLPEFGNWHFPKHFDKGLHFTGGDDLTAYLAITGACMVLRRDLAVTLGGFDEAFVIGDFEDADMCLKIQEMGMLCVIDPTVSLYHLERQSQAAGAGRWRVNLTAYNAWLHEQRWSALITAEQASAPAAG